MRLKTIFILVELHRRYENFDLSAIVRKNGWMLLLTVPENRLERSMFCECWKLPSKYHGGRTCWACRVVQLLSRAQTIVPSVCTRFKRLYAAKCNVGFTTGENFLYKSMRLKCQYSDSIFVRLNFSTPIFQRNEKILRWTIDNSNRSLQFSFRNPLTRTPCNRVRCTVFSIAIFVVSRVNRD